MTANGAPEAWACLCGYLNAGPICTHCGQPKEATEVIRRASFDFGRAAFPKSDEVSS